MIILQILFVLYCTFLQFWFVCSILLLLCCTETNTPRPRKWQWKWWQPLLSVTQLTSISNGGAPDPTLTTIGSFILPSFHLVHPALSRKSISPIWDSTPNANFTQKTDTMILLPHCKIPWSRYWSIIYYRLYLCPNLFPTSSCLECLQKGRHKTISPIPKQMYQIEPYNIMMIHPNPPQYIPRPILI